MKNLLILSLFLLTTFKSNGQYFSDNKKVSKSDGFITFYYDESKDKIYLIIDKLDKEFLYVSSLSEGVGSNDLGLDRGQLGGEKVVKFVKKGNKILLLQPNLDYRAITDNIEEQKSVEEAFAKSVLHGFIIMEEKGGTYLVDATTFFMRDEHGISNTLRLNGQGSYTLDKSKSAFHIERTKAFPKNSEFDVMLTFKGNPKGYHIRSVTPTPSLVTVHQHHSFVELPDNNYSPRVYDPRSGSFSMSYLDYATPVDQPIRKRFIYRHRLEKKNPNALISEAVEPIIYYLDRGTPEPIRSALLDGARWWNQAFEAIGFKDAFQVKMLPEEADPLDVRYNVIQWVHRSTRGWSYGGSVSDPRTGEIIKGHVSLGSLRIRQDFLIAQALQAPYENGDESNFALQMALARIRQLSAHEVGHTIGLAHNFAASTNGRASVMDYPHPKFILKNDKIDFLEAYDTKIGEWDKVAIAYSYSVIEGNEKKELNKILEKAINKGLRFISDQDARPKGSAHAFAHLWDNGKNVSHELENILAIRKQAIANFSENNIRNGVPYSVLEDVFVPLYFLHRYQTEAVTKVIGGLDYSYAVRGDKKIVDYVDSKTQKEALRAVLKTIDVKEISIPREKLKLFPPRAMGYKRSRESFKSKSGVAFDPFGGVETATEMTLDLLLHPQRVTRLVQHKSIDRNQLGFQEVLNELTNNTFKKKHKDDYLSNLQQIVNQQYLMQLFNLASGNNTYIQVKSLAKAEILKIKSYLKSTRGSTLQVAVNNELVRLIESFEKNPEKYQKQISLKIPDGSPIGMK